MPRYQILGYQSNCDIENENETLTNDEFLYAVDNRKTEKSSVGQERPLEHTKTGTVCGTLRKLLAQQGQLT